MYNFFYISLKNIMFSELIRKDSWRQIDTQHIG